MVTDLHHADKPPAGTRHYRETLGKLEEAAKQFEQNKLSFLVELGDLIDAADAISGTVQHVAANAGDPEQAEADDEEVARILDEIARDEIAAEQGRTVEQRDLASGTSPLDASVGLGNSNAVQVTVHRNETLNGEVDFFFASIFGSGMKWFWPPLR